MATRNTARRPAPAPTDQAPVAASKRPKIPPWTKLLWGPQTAQMSLTAGNLLVMNAITFLVIPAFGLYLGHEHGHQAR